MSECTVEFVIEPFEADTPGPHVLSGIKAMEANGLAVAMGPFGSSATGGVAEVSDAIAAMVVSAVNDGARRVLVEVVLEDS